ncbi:MAG: 50S ribosomal protein L17 [Planctomycetota bacterium]
MLHRVRGRKFGQQCGYRKALKRNLLKALFERGRIVTTLPKAKEYRPFAEKLITLARQPTLHNRRRAVAELGNDRRIAKILFESVAPRFVDRNGGYTRILKLAMPRLGDCAPRAILELVGHSEELTAKRAAEEAEEAKGKAKKGDKKAKDKTSKKPDTE